MNVFLQCVLASFATVALGLLLNLLRGLYLDWREGI